MPRSVRRAGGIHARRLARLVVTLGLAESATVTLGWQPGDRWSSCADLVDVARWGHFTDARAWEALRAC